MTAPPVDEWYVCPECGGGFSTWDASGSGGGTAPAITIEHCPFCGHGRHTRP